MPKSNLVECPTCGYPLTEEERGSMERNVKANAERIAQFEATEQAHRKMLLSREAELDEADKRIAELERQMQQLKTCAYYMSTFVRREKPDSLLKWAGKTEELLKTLPSNPLRGDAEE